MKKILVGALTCLFGFIAGYARQDPVLMRINGQDISRSEFESFYHRNKPSGVSGKEALKVCVDLFVDKKLKLHAAQRAGLDTLSAFRARWTTTIVHYLNPILQIRLQRKPVPESFTIR